MATYNIKWLRNFFGTRFFPLTHIKTVRDNNNVDLETLLEAKQQTLVSGSNIKTINGESVLGSGNISVSMEGGGDVNVIESISVNGSAQAVDSNKNVNIEVPDELADLTEDSSHRTVTDTEKSTWNNKQAAISDLADIRAGASAGATALLSYTETDPVFSSSAAANITTTDITNWNNKTSNIGTITGINMNGSSKGTSGVVDLGTVITFHQDISGKADKSATVSSVDYNTTSKKITKTINGTTTDVVTAAKIVTDGGGITEHQDISGKADKATTLSGYGITDAKINNGTITLGDNTITPLTSFTESDPVFSASAASGISSSDITNWNNKTSNTGTITGVSVNGTSVATSGVANITSIPASILDGAIPSSVTATTQSSGDNSTKIATTAYVDTAIDNLPEPMIFKGSLGIEGTITSLPEASNNNIGFTYKVITEGTYNNQSAKVGDTFISDGTSWNLIPSGDEPSGTVTSITLNATSPINIDNSSAITTSGSRTISHATSGVTAGTYKSVTVNETGHVTEGTNPTTLSEYGITDANISNGVITLGNNTITPLTSYTETDPIFSASAAHDITSINISNWNAKYDKPSDGIPKTDLTTDIQTSLDKADSALQPEDVTTEIVDTDQPIASSAVYNRFTTDEKVTATALTDLDDRLVDVENQTESSSIKINLLEDNKANKATTLSGYGITDAKIASGVITLGSNTITPLTSHLSLSNYVTLNSAQTISAKKTFSAQLAFTIATGTSPFTVTSTTAVTNLNSDLLDGYHASGASTGYIIKQGYINVGSTTAESWHRIATIPGNSDYFRKYLLWISQYYLSGSGANLPSCLAYVTVRASSSYFYHTIKGIAGDLPATCLRLYYNTYSDNIEVYFKYPLSTTANRTVVTRVLAEDRRLARILDQIVLDNGTNITPTDGWSYVEMSYVTYQGAASGSSDLRLKNKVNDINLKVEDIAKAPNLTFTWKNNGDTELHGGTYAQYWENITPYYVHGDDSKTLEYGNLALSCSIELAKEVVKLKEENNLLKKELEEIRETINKINK